jgi:type VI secretion system secreted protein VgrG
MSRANQLACFDRRFTFTNFNFSPDTFEVVRFEGEESLGRLYCFEILLVSANNDIDDQKLLGQQAVFQLNDGMAGSEATRYCGLITAFEQQYQITGWTFYKAVLEPKLWRLETFNLTEVYLNKTPGELLGIILDAGGLNGNDYDLSYLPLDGYPAQACTCQYKESYLSFITRWCEYLGVYWWFNGSGSTEQIVFSHDFRNHDAQSVDLIYQPAGELDAVVAEKRRVQSFKLFSQPLPKQVTVTNYFYLKASVQVTATASVSEQGCGEVHYYGMYADTNDFAQKLAKIRAEALICRGRQFSGESSATGLRCGYAINLSGHYRNSFNQKYLLTQITHRGSQAGLLLEELRLPAENKSLGNDFYMADFTAIPAGVQFRPEPRPWLWPRIDGTLTAFIDAEGSGKYAEINEHGEYKVQLPYSFTEKSAVKASAWVRMASPYAGVDDAGSAHGMHFPLHKGAEVLLSFHNGNPDKPVIIGAVTNSQTLNVVANDNQMQSRIRTAGGNEIILHDEEGKQHMLFKTPTGNNWLRMGAGGFDPTASTINTASTPNDIGINIVAPSGDITIDATTGNVNITADNDLGTITLNGATYKATVESLEKTTYGNEVEINKGTKSEFTLGAKTEINTGGWFEGCAGAKISVYGGLVANAYAGAYINAYLLKWDTSIMKWEYVATGHFEAKGLHGKAVATLIKAIGTKIGNTGAEIKNTSATLSAREVAVLQEGAKMIQAQAVMRQSEAEIVSIQTTIKSAPTTAESYVTALQDHVTKIESCQAAILSVEAKVASGPHIFTS